MAGVEERPFPPGSYPVVIVGSGPGGLQLAYSLQRLGVKAAVLSADEGPGGMFRRFPIFQRLISWTKAFAPVEHDSRSYERYDWNSLIGDTPGMQALQAPIMDGSTYFPSREDMEKGLTAFAEKGGVAVRYGCRWESTSSVGDDFILTTSDGEYRCDVPVFAVGMTESWKPDIPGIDQVPHYSETRDPKTYDDKRIFIIGKRNSAFELADGLLPHARQMILASPRPATISINSFHVASARARYLQVYEDYILGGGSLVIDAAIQRIEKTADGFRVHTQGTTQAGEEIFEVDEVIAATGFTTPLGDLRKLGVATFNQDRLPAQTHYWESSSVPGVHFAGSVTQGAIGLKKYGIPSVSGAVQGMRYNSRVLAEHLAETRFSTPRSRPEIPPDELVDRLLSEVTHGAEVWIQRSYLARIVSFEGNASRDEGIHPLAHFVDDDGPDGVAITLETGPGGDIYPALYIRSKGMVTEHLMEGNRSFDFETPGHKREVRGLLKAHIK